MNTDKLLVELKNGMIQMLRNQLFVLNNQKFPDAKEPKDQINKAIDTSAILSRLLDAEN